MPPISLVLLPGLDGTGELFAPLIDRLPSWLVPHVISYPPDLRLSYADLLSYVRERLPADGSYILLAESFSGPIALGIAAESSERLAALLLVATFAGNPLPPFLSSLVRLVARSPLFMLPAPLWGLRGLLLGHDASEKLVEQTRRTIRRVKPAVMAYRVRSVMDIDPSAILKHCRCPALYLAAAHDRVIPYSAGEEIAAALPHLERVEIDAPHFLLQCRPDAAMAVITEFLLRSLRDPAPLSE